jgi:hypothetical protein
VFFFYFENTFETKNKEEYKVFSLVMVILSLCIHIKSLLLLMVRRICIMFDICCEELRRYFNYIIDKSLFFIVIRQKWRSQSLLGEKMAKKLRSQSLFGEENGEVNRSLAKKWRSQSLFGEKNGEEMAKKMAKSIALWRNSWRSQSFFGEENDEEMAKNMAKYYGFNT